MKKSLRFVFSLLAVALVTACGGASDDFIGTWSASGTGTIAYDGFDANTGQIDGTVSISEGVSSELILADPSIPNCIIPFNVKDGAARVVVGATCNMLSDGIRITMTFTSGTATLSGQVIQLTYSGTVSAAYDGRTYPGTFTTTATLTRVGK
ncbi:MAG TPA: hypothetical protein VNA24_32680 [Hyalangium sp.]|jgi:hypothetical protein|nr:hypothetical protein [Hyalangium sp.]